MSTLTETATVADVLDDLDRDGYSIVPGVLAGDEAEAIRQELTAIADTIPHGRNAFEGFHTRRIYALFRKTRLLDGAATHPLVLGVLDEVLHHYQLSAPVGISIGAASSGIRRNSISDARVAKALAAARCRGQLGDLVPRDAHDRRDDELRDAHAARDVKRRASEVDDRHANLAAVIGIDRRRGVRQADAVLHRKP